MPRKKRSYIPKVKGCPQCSRRRIDCDGAKPGCQKCASRGLACSGFGINYRFRDGLNPKFKGQRMQESSEDQALSQLHPHQNETTTSPSHYDSTMATYSPQQNNTYSPQSASPSSSDGTFNDTEQYETVYNFNALDINNLPLPLPNWEILNPNTTDDIGFYVHPASQEYDSQPLDMLPMFDLDFSHCLNQFPELIIPQFVPRNG